VARAPSPAWSRWRARSWQFGFRMNSLHRSARHCWH